MVVSMSVSEIECSKVLSPREPVVAILIGGGLSNMEAARELGLCLGTVTIHVHNIFQKLGVNSRRHLIVRHGTRATVVVGPAAADDAKSPLASRSQK